MPKTAACGARDPFSRTFKFGPNIKKTLEKELGHKLFSIWGLGIPIGILQGRLGTEMGFHGCPG